MIETILLVLTVSLMNILSAFVTGYLIWRTKREAHETLFPARKVASKGPVNIDEFAMKEDDLEKSVLPDAISLQNKVFGGMFGTNELKERKR